MFSILLEAAELGAQTPNVGSLIQTAVTIIFVVLALISAIKGFINGLAREVVRVITIVLAVIISLVAVSISSEWIMGLFSGETMEGVISWVGNLMPAFADWLSGLDADVIRYIAAIPIAMIILPVVFSASFIVINLIMMIPHFIICMIFGFKADNNTILTRLGGLLLGAIEAIFVTVIIATPLIGFANTFGTAIEEIRAEETKTEAEENLINIYDEFVKGAVDNPIIKITGALGGNAIYSFVTTVKVDDQSIAMTEQIRPALQIYGDSSRLADMDWQHLTEEQKSALGAIVDTVDESPYFTLIFANTASAVSSILGSGELADSLEEPLATIFRDLFSVLDGITEETLNEDVKTFLNLWFLFSDEGVFEVITTDAENTMNVLSRKDASGNTVISRAVSILETNPRTSHIVPSLIQISISVMKDSIGLDEEVVQVYENIKTGLNDTLTKMKEAPADQKQAVVTESIDEILVSNGIELDDEIVDVMAEHVVENFGDLEAITDADVADVLLKYYEKYQSGELGAVA